MSWYTFDEGKPMHVLWECTKVMGDNEISNNVVELLSMVMPAWMLVNLCEEISKVELRLKLLWVQGTSVVVVHRCGGHREHRSCALVGCCGASELTSRWRFSSTHVPGGLKIVAYGILSSALNCMLPPDLACHVNYLGEKGRTLPCWPLARPKLFSAFVSTL